MPVVLDIVDGKAAFVELAGPCILLWPKWFGPNETVFECMISI